MLKISLPQEGEATTPIEFTVRNSGDHTDNIGVYADITPPGGSSNPRGCTPNGRILQTVITLAAGQTTKVSTAPLTFSCANLAGATDTDQYTIVAVADTHATHAAACGPGQLQSIACFNAIAADDATPFDNRLVKSCCGIEPS